MQNKLLYSQSYSLNNVLSKENQIRNVKGTRLSCCLIGIMRVSDFQSYIYKLIKIQPIFLIECVL